MWPGPLSSIQLDFWIEARRGRWAEDDTPRSRSSASFGRSRWSLAKGQTTALPAGFRVPPHAHDHDELMIVLNGSCRFDDEVADLGSDDAIVIRANYRYGFTCGPGGMEFLTIRTGEAGMSVA